MSLEIQGVRKTFRTKSGAQEVLRGVDLNVAHGEFVSIIGHSGCGKSTLLNVVGGLVRRDAGSVLLDGEAVTGPGPDRAIVFQHYSLLPWMSVYDNVREAALSSRPDRSRTETDEVTERYLRSTGLWATGARSPPRSPAG